MRLRKAVAESDCQPRHICTSLNLSIRPHATAQLAPDGFS